MCGKRFGNQWFWQVGALLVALQVYNHSFRSSVPRLGNRSFLSVPALYSTPSLSRLSDCCVEDWNWNLRDKSKSPSSSSFSSPVSIKMTVLMNIPLNKLLSCFTRGIRHDLRIFIFARTLYNLSMLREE